MSRKVLRSDVRMIRLCATQVAEIISDVREPIMEANQPVDENESRRQQVQVGNNIPSTHITYWYYLFLFLMFFFKATKRISSVFFSPFPSVTPAGS